MSWTVDELKSVERLFSVVEADEFDINEDFETCIHGVGWDEDCPDCNDYEDEADGLK